MKNWDNVKNILCIRTDNMGDVIMSAPAFRALKQTFDANITVLTSPMGSLITPFIPEIDRTIIFDIPWVKTNEMRADKSLGELVASLQKENFDAAAIFTVYSQNPLPAAMIAYMAGIPLVLGYCRENPYALLSHWIPDKEPYGFIQHQVERDLKMVETVGARSIDDLLHLNISVEAEHSASQKIYSLCQSDDYLIFHPGVSEEKRMYPIEKWIEAGKLIIEKTGKTVVVTGSAAESEIASMVASGIGEGACATAGKLSVEEFIGCVKNARWVVCVNTATVHIAAAVQTPSVVLYALTNPQHTPWQSPSVVLPFTVKKELQSKNEVIRYVNEHYFKKKVPLPQPGDILKASLSLLNGEQNHHEKTEILSV